jgi:hypothetical protein
MTDSNNLISSLNNALSAPTSLAQERQGRGFYIDEHTSANPSEGNMLTLLTMKDLHKGGKDATEAIETIAKEESKYLIHAMKILSTDPESANGTAQRAIRRMQDKFGKDFRGATELSQLLKSKSIEADFEAEIGTFIEGFAAKGKTAGALSAGKIFASP